MSDVVVVGTGSVSFEELVAVARGGAPVALGDDAVAAIERARAVVEDLVLLDPGGDQQVVVAGALQGRFAARLQGGEVVAVQAHGHRLTCARRSASWCCRRSCR